MIAIRAFAAALCLMLSAQISYAQGSVTEMAIKEPNVPIDYYDGLRAWDNGAQVVAISLWLRAAEYGDTRSMWKIALEYELGNILPKNAVLATYYAALAERLEGKSIEKSIDSLDPESGKEVRSAVMAFVPKPSPALPKQDEKPDPIDLVVEAIYGGTEADIINVVRGAPLVKPSRDNGPWPPLFHAAAAGRPDAVKALVAPGTWLGDVRALTSDGLSVMHFAAMSGSIPTVIALSEAGASAFAESPSGLLPSDAAASAGFSKLAEKLQEIEVYEIRVIQEKLNLLGYDVGSPDGVMGPQTRMQFAIAANGLGLQISTITPEVVSAVLLMFPPEVWGAIVNFENKDGSGSYITHYSNLTVRSPKEAEDRALLLCSYRKEAKNCEVVAVMPRGACMALGKAERVRRWSRAFASIEDAQNDALVQCKAAGGRDCSTSQPFCVTGE